MSVQLANIRVVSILLASTVPEHTAVLVKLGSLLFLQEICAKVRYYNELTNNSITV